ncbi:glycosyltransferase [Flavobacteriaceae bacterium]|jgi:uncharacterized protein (TIGR00661 family)|nr:glycosyltransferase [Flavobacteriaceae bacterium]
MKEKQRILVAPLNWGLGHATRCIPIIQALIDQNFEPILASDGAALALLNKEFPELNYVNLPPYNMTYSTTSIFFKLAILWQLRHVLKIIKLEQEAVRKIINDYQICAIISDNRFGVVSKNIPCAFITHQTTVLSGYTTWISTKINHYYINKFNECWVPDHDKTHNLSGILGHASKPNIPVRYLGPLSRFSKKPENILYDYLLLISGPEPQRTVLEKILLKKFESYQGKVVLVRGVVEAHQTMITVGHIDVYNFLTSADLETKILQSKIIIARSGYTTIMDLAILGKRAFFIPTPGQYEQLYLAKRLEQLNITPFCNQHDFEIKQLHRIHTYKGFEIMANSLDYDTLFSFFKCK